MSVINRVLRDLEQRKASQPPSVAPASGVRAVAAPRAGGRTRVVAGTTTVAAVAAVVAVTAGPGLWPEPGAVPFLAPVAAPSTGAGGGAATVAPASPEPSVAAFAADPKPETQPPVREAAAPSRVSAALPTPDALWGAPLRSEGPTAGSRVAPPAPAPVSRRPAPTEAATVSRATPGTVPPAGAEKPPRMPDTAGASAATAPRIEKQERPLSAREKAELAFRAGVAALERRQNGEAFARFDEALGLSADHVPARQAMLGLLLEGRRTADAEALLLEGLDHVRHAPFALVAARLQLDRGDLQSALATLETFEDAGRANPEYLATLAGVLQRAGRHLEAVERYASAISAGEPRAAWLMGRAISLRELGRGADARAAFQQAMDTGALAPEVQVYVEKQIAALRTAGS